MQPDIKAATAPQPDGGGGGGGGGGQNGCVWFGMGVGLGVGLTGSPPLVYATCSGQHEYWEEHQVPASKSAQTQCLPLNPRQASMAVRA